MRFLRPITVIAAFLIIAVSITRPLYSQPAPEQAQPKSPAPRQSQTRRPQHSGALADALAPAINELLELSPPIPESPSAKDSENPDASSEKESKPPSDDAPIKELIAYWSGPGGASGNDPSDKVRRRLLEACEDRP